MRLDFDAIPIGQYSSRSQIARVATQSWIRRELPCLRCSSRPLRQTAENTPSRDFVCDTCEEPYELKSKSGRFSNLIVDGDYRTLLETIREGRTPNLLLLGYDPHSRSVTDLRAVHRTLISELAVIPRRPLSLSARRAGWQGCNIDLRTVPASGRIVVVSDRRVLPWPSVVRAWASYDFMIRVHPEARSWLRDVIACIDRLPFGPFSLDDLYRFAPELSELHPANRNVRPKIRQQLQILVARGILRRVEPGVYDWSL